MAVNLGGRKEVVEPQTKPTSSKPKQNKNSLTFLGVTLVLVIALCMISITISTCKTLSDRVDSLYIDTFNRQKEVSDGLVAMHQILDVNGIILPQSPNTPVRFIVVVENGNVVGMYESKGGVISTIQTNQFEVLRK